MLTLFSPQVQRLKPAILRSLGAAALPGARSRPAAAGRRPLRRRAARGRAALRVVCLTLTLTLTLILILTLTLTLTRSAASRSYCATLFSALGFDVHRCVHVAGADGSAQVAIRERSADEQADGGRRGAAGASCLRAPGPFRMLDAVACAAGDTAQARACHQHPYCASPLREGVGVLIVPQPLSI